MEPENNKTFTVAEFVAFLNIGLKATKVKVIGEVSDVKVWPSGYVYFKLKDEINEAVINCKVWSGKLRMFGVDLAQGMKIVVDGNPEIWAPRGDLSFSCDTIELSGEGTLKKQYDLLFKKLTEEGLFAPENKREIPKYIEKIGVITSGKGEVIYDFKYNLKKFGFKVKVIDSHVEGQRAVEDLLSGINTFRKKDIDVLVIMRGGGTIDSLAPMAPFNNELLIREITGFPVPVIVGIGHHRDVPLICLAADKSESTPTAVAHMLSKSWEEASLFLERKERNIISNYEKILRNADSLIKKALDISREYKNVIYEKYNEVKNGAIASIRNFRNLISSKNTEFTISYRKLIDGFNYFLSSNRQNLEHLEKMILVNNPERQLDLGYSIVKMEGKLVRRVEDVAIGKELDIRVKDGNIVSEIINVNKTNK